MATRSDYALITVLEQLAPSADALDVPPAEGWQYWMDAVTEQDLAAGENTLQVRRDRSTDDAFAVGNVVVNWREPVE
jgi:hypothetical protein